MLHSRLLRLASARGGPLLAFDTSTRIASLCAVGWTQGVVREWTLPAHVMPSEALVQGIADEADSTGVTLGNLAGIVVGLGPGSFTGLRVGLATAKGLSVGAGIPVWGVSSLEVLAAGAPPGLVVTCTNALRGEWFCAAYTTQEDGPPRACLPDAARVPEELAEALRADAQLPDEVIVVGDVAGEAADYLKKEGLSATARPDVEPRIAPAIVSVESEIAEGPGEDIGTLAPRYMRLSEPERKLAAKSSS